MKIPVITAASIKACEAAARAQYATPEVKEARAKAAMEARLALDIPVMDALRAVNGRASSFAITLGSEVRREAEWVEKKLDSAGIPQAERVGTVATITAAGPSAKAYKYTAAGTRITLLRGVKGAWYLTGVERVEIYPKQPSRADIVISEAARDAVYRHAMAPFSVRAAEVKAA
jgi:hypothetical protein